MRSFLFNLVMISRNELGNRTGGEEANVMSFKCDGR